MYCTCSHSHTPLYQTREPGNKVILYLHCRNVKRCCNAMDRQYNCFILSVWKRNSKIILSVNAYYISRHDGEMKGAKLDSAGYPSEYALSNGCFRQMLGLPESPPYLRISCGFVHLRPSAPRTHACRLRLLRAWVCRKPTQRHYNFSYSWLLTVVHGITHTPFR